jgi:hypothetical protein
MLSLPPDRLPSASALARSAAVTAASAFSQALRSLIARPGVGSGGPNSAHRAGTGDLVNQLNRARIDDDPMGADTAGASWRQELPDEQRDHCLVETAAWPTSDAVGFQRRMGGVAAAHSVHTAAGMCRGASKEDIRDRGLCASEAGRRSEDEHLL